ncbi:Linear gramicidin synthase subunit D [Paraburkholderia phenoliruptrix]|uniref:Linear gramicidin synthase subunit D n=1 Tax=Paraburkholderia phenoliruptrix TaxID=252970 RepID=A0A6J5C7S9_9BURK|nr:condensation domain-containing protein [Paraburkholderia phenoliruptrix]CAB3728638.1 Linear gramicidin synthase subunit D [Paraburkholderia phenoliruptrix]
MSVTNTLRQDGADMHATNRVAQNHALSGAASLFEAPHETAAAPATDLVSAMKRHVRARADQLAVRFLADGDTDAHELTYAALNAHARRLAAVLRRHGAPNDRVLLMLPSGLDYVVSFFACQYAGMIAVPAYPPEALQSGHVERLRRMSDDCTARIAVVENASQASLRKWSSELDLHGAAFVSPDEGSSHEGFCIEHAEPDAISFLQYTSGSTSSPKGVMVSHANVCVNVSAMSRGMGCRAGDRMFSWLPLYHDMGLIGSLLMPVLCGFQVTLISPLHFLERPVRWLAGIARERATVTGGPDFAYRLCTDRVRDAQLAGLDLSSLRVAFCGSEPIRQTTLDGFAARFGAHGLDPRAMYACYGLAEATLFLTGVEAGSGAPHTRFSASALALRPPVARSVTDDSEGKAVVGCGVTAFGHELAIVDPQTGERLPDRHVGEVWCGGPSITQGYWENPQATAAVFFADTPGFSGRWLRTGDLGFIHDGQLFFCGRRKDMIVLRGENVYPQDLETVLADRVEWLRRGRVSVFPVEAADGAKGIGVAAEVPRGRARQVAPETIYSAIAAALGDAFRYEAALILLLEPGDLPRTSSGKLQRSACLVAWESGALVPFAIHDARSERPHAIATRAVAQHMSGEALTPTAEIVAQVWSEVLDVPAPCASDDFFALGGRSLLAAKVASRLRERLACEVPVGMMFSHTKLLSLAAALDLRRAASAENCAAISALVRRAESERVAAPLSLPQERLWMLWQIDPDSPAYNISAALSLTGPLDADAVKSSLHALVRRHEILRTRFDDTGGAPRQIVAPLKETGDLRAAWHWEVALARGISDEAFDAQLRVRAREPFDLTRGPLFRATLFVRDDERHVLHFVMHHIIADGWSINVLLRDFSAGYRAARRSGAALTGAPPALAVQYGDYAAWQRERFSVDGGARLDAQLDYWRDRLAGYDALLDLPTLHERGRRYEPRAERIDVRIPVALASRLASLARAENATLFMVLLAAFAALLSRYSGAQDVAIAVPVAGRDRLETEELIGFFVNTLAVRASVQSAMPFAMLLREIREHSIEAQANAEVPFERVAAALQSGRRAGGSPLAQIKFVLHDAFDTVLDLDGVQCALVDADASDARFELALDVLREDAGGLRCVFAYAAELYDDVFVAQFARHYVELLEQITDAPLCTIGELRLDDDEAAGGSAPVAGADAL